MKRKCDVCPKVYNADERNLKRGWGLCCSKSCAAKKREMAKPGYNSVTVRKNNYIRENWLELHNEEDCDDGIDFLCECGSWE